MTDEELISYRDDVREFMIAENEADTRIFQDVSKELLSRLERGRKAMEAMKKAKRLCDVIVNSHPDRMIRGEIESMAFELSTYLNYDNPCKEAIDENRNGEI